MTAPAWTRATTIANTLADRFGLEKWAKRNVALGIAAREDLYALAAACDPADKKQLNRIVEDAEEAAKARSGANLGTAIHAFTERIDRGEDFEVPAAWQPDVTAYQQALRAHKISVDPAWIERVVVVPSIRVAGTLDRLVKRHNSDDYYVADVKTGVDVVKYGMTEIAIQLALYAGATHAWKGDAEDVPRDQWGRYLLPDPEEEPDVYDPMPNVNREKAIVFHIPAGKGKCDIHTVDIEAGRQAVNLAVKVRDWRKRSDLSQPLLTAS